MFKYVKDVRRRTVEATLQTVGKSERTIDENLEAAIAHFHKTVDELNKTGSSASKALLTHKGALNEAAELASLLYRLSAKHTAVSGNAKAMANHYHESWAVINEVLRPSVEVESLERALKPITAHVSAVVPAVDEKTKQRSATVVDYDSYRRRLKEKEVARDAAEAEKANLDAQGKPFKSTDAIRQEVTKYEAKVVTAENLLYDQTAALKAQLKEADATNAALMTDVLLTSLVTQEELFTRAGIQLMAVLDGLPSEYQGKIAEIRADLAVKIDKASREKALSDKVLPPEPRGSKDHRSSLDYAPPPPAPTEPAVTRYSSEPEPEPAQVKYVEPVHKYVEPVQSKFVEPPPQRTHEVVVEPHAEVANTRMERESVVGTPMVTATAQYDNVADSEDELSFMTGDVIEVLDMMGGDENGWGKGRLGFKEGLFPHNFVKHNQ